MYFVNSTGLTYTTPSGIGVGVDGLCITKAMQGRNEAYMANHCVKPIQVVNHSTIKIDVR